MTDARKRRKPGLRITANAGSDVHIDCPDGSRLIVRNEGKHHAQLRFLGPETFRIRRAEIAKIPDAKLMEIQAAYADENKGGGDD